MKILPYFLPLTLLCLLPADINGENGLSTKTDAELLPTILNLTLPIGIDIFKELRKIWEMKAEKAIVIDKLSQISTKIRNYEAGMKDSMDTVTSTLLKAYPKAAKLETILRDLILIKNQLNYTAEQMHDFFTEGFKKSDTTNTTSVTEEPFHFFRTLTAVNASEDITSLEHTFKNVSTRSLPSEEVTGKLTLVDFATWVTGSGYTANPSLLKRMHELVLKRQNGLFETVLDVSRDLSHNMCFLKHSPYQTLYNLYIAIAVTALRGNAVLQFAYTILRINNLGSFTKESKLAIDAYAKRSKENLDSLAKVMPFAEKFIYNCEPSQPVEGKTYTFLVKLLQAYIVNEVDINSEFSCRKKCRDYSPKTHVFGCYKHKFCANQPECRGPVLDCWHTADTVKICRSTKKERRYDWLKYNKKRYGKKKTCDKYNFFKIKMWHRRLFWKCEYCVCLCDDKGASSERYFNLRKIYSDRKNNKVVTGVRIVKKNQIVHLKIQEGVLNPFATVNQSTLSWKPVQEYTVWDSSVKNFKDYFTMDHKWRAINLNQMTGVPGYVVTGVRFRKRNSHVDLDVHVTPFNYTTGKLLLEPDGHSYWISKNKTNPQTGRWRQEIKLWEPDVPVGLGTHSVNSKKYNYILFQPTSYKKDAGQSTVPYLDSQPLSTNGFALSGFGLIHLGKRGSGGFIAPILISYDIMAHLNAINSTTHDTETP